MVLPKWVSGIQGNLNRSKPIKPNRYEECPVCRYGTLTTLSMMDAMSCDFCRHIFSIDPTQPLVQEPILRIEDSAHPLTWQWTGDKWIALPQAEQSLILWLWSLCVAIVAIPSTLMSLTVHLFPAAPQSQGAWFASMWLYLTIGSHTLIALWLLAEHYQWPRYTRLKLMLQQKLTEIDSA